MLEHQPTLDALWDNINDLDARPDGMSADELSRLCVEVDRAAFALHAVAGRIAEEAAALTDVDDGRSAS